MKSKLVGIIILILLFNAIVPNFTQATDVEFDVNHEDFDNVTNSYTKGAFETLKDQGKATLRGRNGNKTKKTEGTLSFGSTLTAAIAGIFYPPAILCSTLMTIISRGNEVIDINSRSKVNWYTIEDTVFNKIDMFDSNYFVRNKDYSINMWTSNANICRNQNGIINNSIRNCKI